MPGRIGPSPETPSPYLPDPDQRLPGFARAALLKNVKNCRSCNPEIRARIDQKRIFSNSSVAAGPLGRTPGCYDGNGRDSGPPQGARIPTASFTCPTTISTKA